MKQSQAYPILEFDPGEAVIEPSREIEAIDIAEHCVLCFFQEVIDKLQEKHSARHIHSLNSEIGDHPIYEITVDGTRLAVYQPGLGAPLGAALLDESIALGCRKFIACGSSGVLDREVTVGHAIIPSSAVRDEGTSYHYLPPGREVKASTEGIATLEKVLREHGCPYIVSKTWTTDAFYRETPARVARRREEGCLTVEMEAAAFFAVAEFRGVTFAQLLYGADDVSGTEWDSRRWDERTSVREKLFWLAAEACVRL